MAPIVIDQRSIFKITAGLVACMALLFFSGYQLGYQQSGMHRVEAQDIVMQQTLALDIPAAEQMLLSNSEDYLAESIEPGYDRDVDTPDAVLITDVVSSNKVVIEDAIEPPVLELTTDLKQEAIPAPVVDEVHKLSIAVGGPLVTNDDDPLALLADSADELSARYTIQVGLYGDMDNAERKVEDLLAQRLSAYSTEFNNKQDKLMFNVRFGYYISFASARSALETYKAALSSDGYIIKLKR